MKAIVVHKYGGPEVLTYEVKDGQEHYIVDEMDEGGRHFNTEYTAKLDGKEYPNKNLVTGAVTYVSIKQMFPRVEELTNIRHTTGPDGKEVSEVTGHYIRILSADGKEYTSVLTNAKGDVTPQMLFWPQSDVSSVAVRGLALACDTVQNCQLYEDAVPK